MFNFCVILKVSPFYVLAQNETEVENILKVYPGNVATVIKADNLQVLEFKMQMSLFSQPTLLIPEVVSENQDYLSSELSESEQDELISDLTDDIK